MLNHPPTFAIAHTGPYPLTVQVDVDWNAADRVMFRARRSDKPYPMGENVTAAAEALGLDLGDDAANVDPNRKGMFAFVSIPRESAESIGLLAGMLKTADARFAKMQANAAAALADVVSGGPAEA